MHERWHIELFGGLRAIYRDRVVTRFRSQKTSLLLSYLALHREQQHSREVLIDMLWPEASIPAGRQSLSTSLTSLRHQLEPPDIPSGSVLLTPRQNSRATVGFNMFMVTTDVAEFKAALQPPRQGESSQDRITQLTKAVDLYRTGLLPGFYEEWIQEEHARLEQLYIGSLEHLAMLLAQQGEPNRGLEFLHRILVVDKTHERTHQKLIQGYAQVGEHALALRQCSALEQALASADIELSHGSLQLIHTVRGSAPPIADERKLQIPVAVSSNAVPVKAATGADPLLPAASTVDPRPLGTRTFLIVGSRQESHSTTSRQQLEQIRTDFGGHSVAATQSGIILSFGHAGRAVQAALVYREAAVRDGLPPDSRPSLSIYTLDVSQSEFYDEPLPQLMERLLARAAPGEIVCGECTRALLRHHSQPAIDISEKESLSLLQSLETETIFIIESTPPPLNVPDDDFGATGYLPVQPRRFFGRESELERLLKLLMPRGVSLQPEVNADACSGARLVTLTGLGGSGKTHLALQVATRVESRWSGRVWFVDLAQLDHASDIVNAVCATMGIKLSRVREPLPQLVDQLKTGPCLLVLDNFEQLLDDGTEIVGRLLTDAPTLTLVVTSRVALRVPQEVEVPVPPLPTACMSRSDGWVSTVPPTRDQLLQTPSVQMFLDRACMAVPHFSLSEASVASVAELCERLEGIPLALELAAGRSHKASVRQMLAGLDERLDFQSTYDRNQSSRQRTLRATLDWTFELLDEPVQRFLARLAVFRDGFDSVSAAVVGLDVRSSVVCLDERTLEYLEELHRWSLLDYDATAVTCGDMVAEGARVCRGRYRMLETLREYGLDWLERHNELEAVRLRHAKYFAELQSTNLSRAWCSEQAAWLKRLDYEQANIRTAMAWSLQHSDQEDISVLLLKLAYAYLYYCRYRHRLSEACSWAEQVLAISPVDSVSHCYYRGLLLQVTGEIQFLLSQRWALEAAQTSWTESQRQYQRVLDLDKNALPLVCSEMINVERNLAMIARERGEIEPIRQFYRERLAEARATQSQGEIVGETIGLAGLASIEGDYNSALQFFEEILPIMRHGQSQLSLFAAFSVYGDALRLAGECNLAHEIYAEAMDLIRDYNLKGALPGLHCLQAWLARDEGRCAEAFRLFQASLPRVENEYRIRADLNSLCGLAGLLVEIGQVAAGAQLFGAVEAGHADSGRVMFHMQRRYFDPDTTAARAALGDIEFEECRQAGLELTLPEAIDFALSLSLAK